MLRLPLLYLTSASLFDIFFRVRQIGLLTLVDCISRKKVAVVDL